MGRTFCVSRVCGGGGQDLLSRERVPVRVLLVDPTPAEEGGCTPGEGYHAVWVPFEGEADSEVDEADDWPCDAEGEEGEEAEDLDFVHCSFSRVVDSGALPFITNASVVSGEYISPRQQGFGLGHPLGGDAQGVIPQVGVSFALVDQSPPQEGFVHDLVAVVHWPPEFGVGAFAVSVQSYEVCFLGGAQSHGRVSGGVVGGTPFYHERQIRGCRSSPLPWELVVLPGAVHPPQVLDPNLGDGVGDEALVGGVDGEADEGEAEEGFHCGVP